MPDRKRKEETLTKGKDDKAKAKVAGLKDVAIKGSRKVTYTTPAVKENGKVLVPPEVKVEELITVELADGSTLTVDANSPEHTEKIEQVAAKERS